MEKGHTIKVLDKGYVRYVDHLGSDMRIVEAARVSYGSASKGEEQDKKLLHYLYKNKHTSPFEMPHVTMDFKMPIFVMRQYIRHRMQNLNEFSMRYTEAPDEFYIPTIWRAQDTKNKQSSFVPDEDHDGQRFGLKWSQSLEAHCTDSFAFYKEMLEFGIAREMARIVLPLNIYTYFYATWDLKNLLHFITLRDDSHAQAEIQEYGRAIKSILIELFLWTMEAYERYKFPCLDMEKARIVELTDKI